MDNSLGRNFEIEDSVSIIGLGQDNLTLEGSFFFQITEPSINVALDGLNIVGGKIDNSGNLSFSNSTIADSFSIGTEGSAIISKGTINIVDSTIKDGRGGENNGILVESGTGNIERSLITNHEGVLGASGVIILEDATVNISNSTITNNRDRFAAGVANAGTVNITNSTITNNGGLGGGGIANPGTARVTSSIIADNFSGSSRGDVSGSGLYVSGGNNLIGNGDDAEGFVDGVNGDLVGSDGDDPGNPQTDLLIDPQLGELQNNGGSTETLALLEDSPAIDAGSNPNNLETDQRGEGFDRTVGNATDIGAYEVQDTGGEVPEDLVVSTLEDENDGDFSEGDLSLREAIALSNQREGADAITFDNSLNDGTISINESLARDLTISDSVTIDGLGQDNLTLDGGFIFNVETNVDLILDGLNLVGSKIDSSGNLTFSNSTISQTVGIGSADNSAIISRGSATIVDSTIKDNNGGGNVGILIESGTATIERSAITGNNSTSFAQSGIIIRSNTTVDIINSTIANNQARSNAGIENAGGTVNITNSTIVNNRGGLGGGGVKSFLADGVVTITSSIVANNTGTDESFPVGDLSGEGEFVSGGNNLIGNGDDVEGFVDGVNCDLVGSDGDDLFNPDTELLIDPKLGELQNNGGSTETFTLLEDSPAIDAGSNPNNLATDQRGEGFDRTVGNGTDIGAYEVQTPSSSEDIIGTDNSDVLRGTAESDRIFGLDGADLIKGLASGDFLSGGNGNDFIKGGNGADTIEGDAGNDLIRGGNGFDVLKGGDGHDRILGNRGADTIEDGAGNDVLFGGKGNDIFLAANAGYDRFTGGKGADIYVYDLNSDLGFDRDHILDFQRGEDKIVFRPFSDDLTAFDEFADLDTNGSGILDSDDTRVHIIGNSTVIDFSDLFGHSHNSDTITLVSATDLDESNFLFNETVVGAELC